MGPDSFTAAAKPEAMETIQYNNSYPLHFLLALASLKKKKHNDQQMSGTIKHTRHFDQEWERKTTYIHTNKSLRDGIKNMYIYCGCFWVGASWKTLTFYLLVHQYFLFFSPVVFFFNLCNCVIKNNIFFFKKEYSVNGKYH